MHRFTVPFCSNVISNPGVHLDCSLQIWQDVFLLVYMCPGLLSVLKAHPVKPVSPREFSFLHGRSSPSPFKSSILMHMQTFGRCAGSFAGLGYLAMYLAGKIGFFDRRGHSWKLFPVLLPLLVAAFVGVSRIDNYRHHWFDVVVAALLGKTSCPATQKQLNSIHIHMWADDLWDSAICHHGRRSWCRHFWVNGTTTL